uniref:Protein kinase domain-containing protein n=1 Tax=viral metagenome TaxID=1070528 RepID=A0A6C0DQQ0_9ZZZZ
MPIHSWLGNPSIDKLALPICSHKGVVKDLSGTVKFLLKPKGVLGRGTFGIVEIFDRIDASTQESRVVAMKRPTHPSIDLYLEALVQKKLHTELQRYGLHTCIPEVYDIIQDSRTKDVWFTMEALDPQLLSQWCVRRSYEEAPKVFGLLLLQIALVLQVLEDVLQFDHRDLKVNNILIADTPLSIAMDWKGESKTLEFPFRVVFVDFGFSCIGGKVDVRDNSEFPPLDPCPKVGRDMFQVIVSLWSIHSFRSMIENAWGAWVRERLGRSQYIHLTENSQTLEWMYMVTDVKEFQAPLCTPFQIIQDCIQALEGI